ncbi:MAG: protein kinase [Verrucomicrobiae bacterium]|nr:protein kinase [Verrucomicrobiae bacterium]
MKPDALPDEVLFEAALNCGSAVERSAYLDRVCAGQPGLRQRLEQLLHAHAQAEGFLEQPAGDLGNVATVTPPRRFEEAPGTVVGRYKLLQKIGEGGMGDVYMAEQTEPVIRKVALKIIKLGMDTRQVVARFEAERQALALMDHPNIAKVLDAGTTGPSSIGSSGRESAQTSDRASKSRLTSAATIEAGRPYFVMELVHGVPITEYCDQNRLSTRERLDLFIPVCQAVQHAHQKGIIHRDLKPSNVMVTLHDGVPVPKVIDFGVAKATNQRLTEKTLFTNYGQMIGTPAYMSPEQAEMSGLDIDTRSDVYSLGVLLYELLTGATPFDAKELLSKGYAEMQRIIAEQEPPKPSTRLSTLQDERRTVVARNRGVEGVALTRTLRGDLDWIVMKCLEKDRTRRYETANGVATDLRRHLNAEAVMARPPSTAYLVQRLIKRNKLVFACGAVVGLAMILTLVVLIVTTVRVTRERNQKELALQAESAAKELATERAQETREQLFVALKNQALGHRYSGRIGQRVESLAALSAAARIRQDESLRDEAIAALALPDVRRAQGAAPWVTGSPVYAPDDLYQRYGRLDPNGDIVICTTADTREIQRIATNPKSQFRHLSLSPDGNFVAKLEDGGHLRVWAVADGRPVLEHEPIGCTGVAFSHDSRWLAVGQGDTICRIDLQTGLEINRWNTAAPVQQLAIDSQDQRIAVAPVRGKTVLIHRAANGQHLAQLPVEAAIPQVLAWHRDGIHLAVGGSDSRIEIWDIRQPRRIASLEGHVQRVTDLTFHPQSDLLASYGWDGVLRLWEPWSGRQLLQTPAQTYIRFSSDGRWLGSEWAGANRFQLLEIAPSSVYSSLPHLTKLHFTSLYDGDISPDGRWLVCGTDNGVQLRSLPGGQLVATLSSGLSPGTRFRPDGQAIFTCGDRGLNQWPFERVGPDQFRLGPPTRIQVPLSGTMRMSLSSDGQSLAVVGEETGRAVILNPTSGQPPHASFDHPAASFLALSKDARLLATSGWHSRVVRLFETQGGQLLGEWPVPPYSRVFLSPDDRMLVISQGFEISFWDAETAELIRRVPRQGSGYGDSVAFSSDGTLIALPTAPGIVEIQLTDTGRTVARLEDPFGDRSGWMTFTADNRELIVFAGYVPAIHVWHLDELRRQLSEFSGDWPGFPPLLDQKSTNRTGKHSVPTIEVLGLELLENK